MTRPLLAAASLLALPLLLTGCSGGSSSAHPSKTPSASPTDPNFMLTLAYIVDEPTGTTRPELEKQLPTLWSMAGVQGAKVTGPHQLRVSVKFAATTSERMLLVNKLRALGKVTGAPIEPGSR